jgi:hypothetical protein
VDPNADVDQSKVFVDPLLGEFLEERKIDSDIFQGGPKKSFKGLFFGFL